MAKKLYEESNISAIASAIRTKNGLSSTYSVSAMAAAILSITPKLEALSVSSNGSYSPSEGKDGFSEVVVTVPSAVMSTLEVSSNGSFTPGQGVDGFNNVVVSVPAAAPSLVSLNVSSNGSYTPGQGVDGFSEVVVDVQGGSASGTDFIAGILQGSVSMEYVGAEVSFIVSSALRGNQDFSGISLPNCVTIGREAFAYGSMKNIYLPKCETLEASVFYSCFLLESIDLPSLTAMGQECFQDNRNLSFISIPLLSIIPIGAFSRCSNLETVYCPACTEIQGQSNYSNRGAFFSCSKLMSINLPLCTSIGRQTFDNCIKLSIISVPLLEYAGSAAFAHCNLLSEIYLPELVSTSLYLFNQCEILSIISVPKLTSVAQGTFQMLSNLSTLSLPKVSIIYNAAFQQCIHLKSLYLMSDSVVTLSANDAFNYTPMVNSSYYSGEYGSIFVPMSLVDSYKAANNWSTISDRIVGYNPLPTIVPWSTGTDAEIVAMVAAMDAGLMSAGDTGWQIGDERVVSLESMISPYNGTIESQNITLVLVDSGIFDLTSGGKDHFVVAQKDCLSGANFIPKDLSNNKWASHRHRTWCNGSYKSAFPSSIVDIFKQFILPENSAECSTEYFAFHAKTEVTGDSSGTNESGLCQQLEYYETSENRIKKDNGAAKSYCTRSPWKFGSSHFFYINSDGGCNSGDQTSNGGENANKGAAPFGCI